jgi:serine/threonine-protein kinase
MSQTATREDRLEAVFEAYVAAVEADRPFDRKAAIDAHPDLATELAEFFENEDWMRAKVESARRMPGTVPLPFQFGKYEVLEELGRGGMGVVYKARNLELGRLEALKVIRMGQFASAAEIARFKDEARAASELDHPNIVPIYEFGEHEGQHYFTMKLIEGKSLQANLDAYRNDPLHAVRLMATVAGAVGYANGRLILHRDLKPGNILLDAAGQPHVTDFGLAKRLDSAGEVDITGEFAGTVPYMPPEQVSRQKKRLNVSVDVYGLGATLFALVTGRPPFLGETFVDTIRKIQDEPAPDPRTFNPRVSKSIAAICLKCLQKDPLKRYENTTVLADRLEKVRDGLPIPEVPETWLEKVRRSARRHAGAITLAAMAAALVLAVAGHFLFRAATRAGRRQEILLTNATMAQDIADRFRRQLKEWSDRIQRAAGDPELAKLLESRDFDGLQQFCQRMPFDLETFDSWTVLDAGGTMRARTPDNFNRQEARNFRERDYFQGPLVHVERGIVHAHVSRAFRTTHAQTYNIALSAPVVQNATVLGVLRVSVSTGTTLGLAQLHDSRRRVVVVAPWETSYPQDDTDKRPGYRIILHPSLTPAQTPVPLSHPHIVALSLHSCGEEFGLPGRERSPLYQNHYLDPVDGGSWLAGFAPIGNTGHVVIVQQREE